MKILLVEDNEITVNVLAQELTTHNYTVETTMDGQTGLELAKAFHYDLLMLDIILPNLDGISLCRQVRSHGLQMPILLLSAKDSSTDRVQGLEAGADDYVVKPYELNELIARIQALLRRGSSSLRSVLTWEKLQIEPDTCKVTYGEELVRLTPKEYGILELFLRNPRRIFSRSAIIDQIWRSGEFPQEDAVSTQIKGLRQKLKAAGMTTDLIETVYGLGYRQKAPPCDTPSPKSQEVELVETQLSTTEPLDKHQAQAKVMAAVQQMWVKFKQSLGAKIALFEQAIAQLSTGTLDQELHASAQAEAHRLIGSLGTLGLPKGSEIMRQIEQLLRLESPEPQLAPRLKELIEQLKQAVENKPATTTKAPLNTTSGRLLLVDEDLVLSEQIKQEGSAWGLQVEVATNPTEAKKAISQHPPDIIVLDLTFPQTTENGLTLLAELTKANPEIKVLVMTGQNQLSDLPVAALRYRVEVARLGGQAFLQKPLTTEQILKAVTKELNRTQKPEAKILIVDDDRHVLAALSTLLEPWGLQVTTLAEPQQFWQVLFDCAPDLLILDIEMPGFNGIQLCQVVRNDPHWSDLPVLFLSSHNDADIVYQVFTVGADDYVQKPIVGPELIARILNRLKRSRIRYDSKQKPMS